MIFSYKKFAQEKGYHHAVLENAISLLKSPCNISFIANNVNNFAEEKEIKEIKDIKEKISKLKKRVKDKKNMLIFVSYAGYLKIERNDKQFCNSHTTFNKLDLSENDEICMKDLCSAQFIKEQNSISDLNLEIFNKQHELLQINDEYQEIYLKLHHEKIFKRFQKATGSLDNLQLEQGLYYLKLCYKYGFGTKQNLPKATEYANIIKELDIQKPFIYKLVKNLIFASLKIDYNKFLSNADYDTFIQYNDEISRQDFDKILQLEIFNEKPTREIKVIKDLVKFYKPTALSKEVIQDIENKYPENKYPENKYLENKYPGMKAVKTTKNEYHPINDVSKFLNQIKQIILKKRVALKHKISSIIKDITFDTKSPQENKQQKIRYNEKSLLDSQVFNESYKDFYNAHTEKSDKNMQFLSKIYVERNQKVPSKNNNNVNLKKRKRDNQDDETKTIQPPTKKMKVESIEPIDEVNASTTSSKANMQ